MLTGDTITDEHIRDLLVRREISGELAVETGARLSGGYWYPPADVRQRARARCAEIINTRPKDAK